MAILVTRVRDLSHLVSGYRADPNTPIAFDTETTGLNFLRHRLITLQFMKFGYEPVILDVRQWANDDFQAAGELLQALFDTCTVVGMNLIFDYKFIRAKTGASMRKCYDVMLAEQLIYGLGKTGGRTKGIEFNLKAIASRYGLAVSKTERDIFPDMDKRPDEWNAPFSEATVAYMAQDVEVLEDIFAAQAKHLQQKKLGRVCRLEHKALPATASIEYNGIYIDASGWRKVIAEKEAEAGILEAEAVEVFGEAIARARAKQFKKLSKAYQTWKKAKDTKEAEVRAAWDARGEEKGWGEFKKTCMREWRELNPNPGQPKQSMCFEPINLGSYPQMLDAFGELNIPLKSTSSEAIAELPEGMYPEVDLLKRWRAAQMYPSKFGENLLSNIDPVTGRIYPNYVQIGADTGRMSCTNPPWQQIPAKGVDGQRLRACVTAREGNVLLTSDYPNIELRILADLSGDKNMLQFFADGVDLHSATAKMMFNLPDRVDVKHEYVPGTNVTYRQVAKTINFGLVYGMSANKLALTLKITKDQAKELMDRYFTLYPGVVRWLKWQRVAGVETLVSTTVSGRKRFYSLPDPHSQEYRQQRAAVERKACNSPIQGSSADITKLALALAYERLPEAAQIVAVVHDEIVVECPKVMAEVCASILAGAMQDSCTKFLKRVAIPDFEVAISDHWEK